GSTCAIFPIDDVTLTYLRLTGRSDDQVALVEAYAKEQRLWHVPDDEPAYSEKLELDLSTVVPSLAGPKRPQDRVSLSSAKDSFREALKTYVNDNGNGNSANEASKESFPASDPPAVSSEGAHDGLEGGHGLLREGRPHAVSRQARFRPCRLRLHDVHRQQRTPHPRGESSGQRPRPRRRVGAVRQPQLRRPHQPRREDELPRVPAAARCLCATRLDAPRLAQLTVRS